MGKVKNNTLAGDVEEQQGVACVNPCVENTLAIEVWSTMPTKHALESLPEDGNAMFKGIMNFNLAVLHHRLSDFEAAHGHLDVAERLNDEYGTPYFVKLCTRGEGGFT